MPIAGRRSGKGECDEGTSEDVEANDNIADINKDLDYNNIVTENLLRIFQRCLFSHSSHRGWIRSGDGYMKISIILGYFLSLHNIVDLSANI